MEEGGDGVAVEQPWFHEVISLHKSTMYVNAAYVFGIQLGFVSFGLLIFECILLRQVMDKNL